MSHLHHLGDASYHPFGHCHRNNCPTRRRSLLLCVTHLGAELPQRSAEEYQGKHLRVQKPCLGVPTGESFSDSTHTKRLSPVSGPEAHEGRDMSSSAKYEPSCRQSPLRTARSYSKARPR